MVLVISAVLAVVVSALGWQREFSDANNGHFFFFCICTCPCDSREAGRQQSGKRIYIPLNCWVKLLLLGGALWTRKLANE